MNLFSITALFLPLLQAGALVCLCFNCFDDYNSAEVHHGCLVKERSQVFYGVQLRSNSPSSVENCARSCAERYDCAAFHVENHNSGIFQTTCTLYGKGEIYASASSTTAGFCPKGIVCNSTYFWLWYILQRKSEVQQRRHWCCAYQFPSELQTEVLHGRQ